jgi:hypothetical protein
LLYQLSYVSNQAAYYKRLRRQSPQYFAVVDAAAEKKPGNADCRASDSGERALY